MAGVRSAVGPDRTLRVGTRASRLALWQTGHVISLLQLAWPDLTFEQVPIHTTGDRVTDVPLARVGDKGLFTRELEDGLHAGTIDVAVHSLKDLPTEPPSGLALGAILAREDPRDALVAAGPATLASLAAGARVGTSSLRRRAQLLAHRPDLEVVDLRGNVPTRLKRVLDGDLDAAVLALAGLRRLGLETHVTERLDPGVILPAPGQGAVAVQIRGGDGRVEDIVGRLDSAETRLTTTAERGLLARLEGGCHVPIGALGELAEAGGHLTLRGLVATLDGRTVIRADGSATVTTPAEAQALGEAVAEELRAKGAGEILTALGPGALAGTQGGEA
jgi:hydroxymethylbilane synthase